jgi:hypothetical protein
MLTCKRRFAFSCAAVPNPSNHVQANKSAAQTGSSNSSFMHKGGQQLSKQPQLLQKPKPHSNACSSSTIASSSSSAFSASQRLLHAALNTQAAGLECNSHGACSPLSEQDAQCTVPSHVVPMVPGMVRAAVSCLVMYTRMVKPCSSLPVPTVLFIYGGHGGQHTACAGCRSGAPACSPVLM